MARNQKNKDQNPIVYPHLQEELTNIQQQQQQEALEGTTYSITWFPETWTIQKKIAQLLEDTKDIPFWIYRDKPELHKQILKTTRDSHPYKRPLCCFNHYISLPKKQGIPKPLFDYELNIFDHIEKYDDIIIVKARGLGITEFFLRYFVWKAVHNKEWYGRTGALITGIRQDTATELIRRIRGLFLPFGIFMEGKEDTFTINGVRFKAFPAYNVDALRSYTDFCFEFADEAGFFPPKQMGLLRESVEGYRLKSKPKIIWNSTQGETFGDVMDQIQDEIKKGISPYKLLQLPYNLGVGKIYDPELIEQEKQQPYFPREYELKKAYGLGDLFLESTIQKCLDIKYDPSMIVGMSPKCIGLDPSYGSSKFGICVCQFVDGRIQVVYAEEFDRPEPQDMERTVLNLIHQYAIFNNNQTNGQVIIDGANIAFAKYLKTMVNERTDYEDIDEDDFKYMRIRPINFGTTHRKLLSNMIQLVSKGYVAIDPKFEELLLQLRIAKVDDRFGLIKKPNSLDLVDALRLSLYGFEMI
jgi:hypothetical protein